MTGEDKRKKKAEYMRAWREKNRTPERMAAQAAYQRQYYQEHIGTIREQKRASSLAYYHRYADELRVESLERYHEKAKSPEFLQRRVEQIREWRKRHPEDARKPQRKLKEAIVRHYSQGTMECFGCWERDIDLLTVDHVNRDGAKHIRAIQATGMSFYRWIVVNGFPAEPPLRILCWNCQWRYVFRKPFPKQVFGDVKEWAEKVSQQSVT